MGDDKAELAEKRLRQMKERATQQIRELTGEDNIEYKMGEIE